MSVRSKAADVRAVLDTVADWWGGQIERFSIWRWHIMFMFMGLGLYLVALPLLHLIVVSIGIEEELGNYTNVVSAGVSLLTLAEAKRISDRQNAASPMKLHREILDAIHDVEEKRKPVTHQTTTVLDIDGGEVARIVQEHTIERGGGDGGSPVGV